VENNRTLNAPSVLVLLQDKKAKKLPEVAGACSEILIVFVIDMSSGQKEAQHRCAVAINPLAADLPHIASKASVRPRIDLKDVLCLKAHHIPQLDDLRKRMVVERPFEHPLRNDLPHEHPHPFSGCRRVRPAKGALD